MKKGTFVIVRGRDCGVHAGEFVSRKGREVVLANSRRIWYWSGAASLSELAVYGAKNPTVCKFGVPISGNIELLDTCEVIPCAEAGERMIRTCHEWRA